jgi:hypothetical protein
MLQNAKKNVIDFLPHSVIRHSQQFELRKNALSNPGNCVNRTLSNALSSVTEWVYVSLSLKVSNLLLQRFIGACSVAAVILIIFTGHLLPDICFSRAHFRLCLLFFSYCIVRFLPGIMFPAIDYIVSYYHHGSRTVDYCIKVVPFSLLVLFVFLEGMLF